MGDDAAAASARQKDGEFVITELEGLSGKRAKWHFAYIYAGLVVSTCLSLYDYIAMWECTNVCGEITTCSRNETSAVCGSNETTTEVELPYGTRLLLNGVSETAHWDGDVSGLHWLNRFMHLTVQIEVKNEEYLPYGYGYLLLHQRVHTQYADSSDRGSAPYSRVSSLDMTHCNGRGTLCSSSAFRVMAEGRGVRRKVEVWLTVEPDAESQEEYDENTTQPAHVPLPFDYRDASLLLEYQTGVYTTCDLCLRVLLFAATVFVYLKYVKDRDAMHKTPEQKWMPVLLFALLVYLNPVAWVSALGSFGGTTFGLVCEFIEFHAATWFTVVIQVMYIDLILRMRGPVSCLVSGFWIAWFVLMIAVDTIVAIVDRKPSSDYTSTYIGWVLSTSVEHLGMWAGSLYIGAMVLAGVWVMTSFVVTQQVKSHLRTVLYGPTRRVQLAFRSLVFVVWSYVVSRVTCLLLYWLLLGKYRPAYRSADETGAVLLSSILTFSLVFQFAPAVNRTEDAPPHPGEPAWDHPRWRLCKWRDQWYDWLRAHGGALYYFTHEHELETFVRFQREKVHNLLLLSAPRGWPVRERASLEAPVVYTVGSSTEIQCVRLSGGWHQLLDGYFFCENELGVEGYWESPETLGFTMQAASTYMQRKRREKDIPLFFCVETAAMLADLSYSVYYPPGPDDFEQAQFTRDSFGWSIAVEYCTTGTLTLVAAIAASATGLVHAEPPSGNSPAASPSTTPSMPPRASVGIPVAPAAPLAADLRRLGLRLIDVIELAGTQAFVTVPLNGTRRVLVSFRGSDNRFTRVNLMTDLRFQREVWMTMAEATVIRGCVGCCRQPLLHRGFMEMWEKSRGGHALHGPLQNIPLRDAVLGSVDRAIRSFGTSKKVAVYCTGHSLGGALACLLAYSLKKRRGVDPIVYTFGLPKLGNKAFADLYDSTVPNTFRVVFEYDPVYAAFSFVPASSLWGYLDWFSDW
eukprot:gene2979-4682_t